MYYLQSRYYNPEWGRFINADAFVSTGQGLLGNNMFAYCNNNPVIYYDVTGDSALPIPSLADFYQMHKAVQYDIVEEYGFAMEVYVSGYRGRGFLDLFDAANNQYYEVKSLHQAGLATTVMQMEKYDVARILDIRFLGYYFGDSPQRGEDSTISGQCKYSYWDIYYSSDGNGLITYRYILNNARYKTYLATLAVTATVVVGGSILSGSLGFGGKGLSFMCKE